MKKTRILCLVLSCLLLMSLSGLGGFYLGRQSGLKPAPGVDSDAAEKADGCNLPIHATIDKDTGFTTIPLGQTSGDFQEISYLGLRDVTIEWNGSPLALEDALLDGCISIDELVSLAHLDAAAGFCEAVPASKNGLTTFTYQYPGFDLLYIHDLYETPDEKQHLISKFAICAPGRSPSFLCIDEETGKPIDYEDWGLRFQITQLSPTGVTLDCAQSGGQQFGTLTVTAYTLYRRDAESGAEEYLPPLADEDAGEAFPEIALEMGGQTECTLDFTRLYGALPTGDYVLYLQIEDRYGEADVPPLARNFHDIQQFAVEFSVADAV